MFVIFIRFFLQMQENDQILFIILLGYNKIKPVLEIFAIKGCDIQNICLKNLISGTNTPILY